jgi:hypothetical protein
MKKMRPLVIIEWSLLGLLILGGLLFTADSALQHWKESIPGLSTLTHYHFLGLIVGALIVIAVVLGLVLAFNAAIVKDMTAETEDFNKLKKKLGPETIKKFYEHRTQWLLQGISGNDATFEKLHLYGVIRWRKVPTQADRVIHWILTETGKKFIEYLEAHPSTSDKGSIEIDQD